MPKAPVDPKAASNELREVLEVPKGGGAGKELESQRKGKGEKSKDAASKGSPNPAKAKGKPPPPAGETPNSGQGAQAKKGEKGESPAPKGEKGESPAPKQATKKKEKEMWADEMLNRGQISPRLIVHLGKKCGPPIQEHCVYQRIDTKRPPGRLDETYDSRHERVPPAGVVLMFNCFEAGFKLLYGDISTLPEAEAVEIRSIRSHAVLGVAHILPTKNAPLEDRIVFKVCYGYY